MSELTPEGAEELVIQLVVELTQARVAVDEHQRRAIGIRKMIDGLVEMFPATEDLLPEDLDDDEEPRPRGAEAVRRVLVDRPTDWLTVPMVVDLLRKYARGHNRKLSDVAGDVVDRTIPSEALARQPGQES